MLRTANDERNKVCGEMKGLNISAGWRGERS